MFDYVAKPGVQKFNALPGSTAGNFKIYSINWIFITVLNIILPFQN